MEGQIVKIIRQTHIVNCDNENYACHCRGKIRNVQKHKQTAPYDSARSRIIIEEDIYNK